MIGSATVFGSTPILARFGSRVLLGPGKTFPSAARPSHHQFGTPIAPLRQRFYSSGQGHSHQHQRSSFRSSRVRIEYLILPLALSSATPLLLESEHPTLSFKTITSSVPKPVASEFRITQAQEDKERRKASLLWRVLWFVRDYVIEPISTTIRFVHLALLFLPVIIASPILLLETLPEGGHPGRMRFVRRREEERGSTRWWYSLLVNQMRRAGPTFVKVSTHKLSIETWASF